MLTRSSCPDGAARTYHRGAIIEDMPWTEEPMNPDDPGVRRIYWATIGEPSPEDAAHLARLADRHAREQPRRAQRRDVPAFRKPPRRESPFTKQPAPFSSFSTPNTRPGSNSSACVDTPPVSHSTSSHGTLDHTTRRSVTA
ncbi:hypothetical protein [Rhodococcus sp. HNM0569]|uniref:hypothetical protein n=1 Tax=Rhodococcus sp. HNM0569 TaxID=2716340 RepID=UPI00146C3DBF|nr:hypothetical protein [Rhodococcus sp. HNM0569]